MWTSPQSGVKGHVVPFFVLPTEAFRIEPMLLRPHLASALDAEFRSQVRMRRNALFVNRQPTSESMATS
jgi:hypothetical protein